MPLSSDLISQFVQITKQGKQKKESIVYGTIKPLNGKQYVQLDGSELLTPFSTTADVVDGERVAVMIKDHTAVVTGNISSPSARNKELKSIGQKVDEYDLIIANKVSTEQFQAEVARIDSLVSDNATIKNQLTATEAVINRLDADNATINEKLTATEATVEDLKTKKLDADVAVLTYATIEDLQSTQAKINNLESTYGTFHDLTTQRLDAAEANIDSLETNKLDASVAEITYAKISDLEAINANFDNLEADVAKIDTLIFGSASGDTIQTSFANAVIAQLGDAQIKSAMIESISASKITSGDVITNNVHVKSNDGKLLISDETIQISDGTRVRVQIGKDSSNDYSINIWDTDGKLMFSEGGITDSAIKEAIIRDDMVSNTANISAYKLNIDSLFEVINGSSNTIKSTRIYLDDEGQSLDVAFKSLTTDATELRDTIASQGTEISVIQGQIASKVWTEDMAAVESSMNARATEISDQHSVLEQEVDSLTAKVASHTTTLENKADSSTVTTIDSKVTELEASLSGFKSSVITTYATKNEFNNLKIGGRNLIAGTDETQEYTGNASGSSDGYKDVWAGQTISIPTETEYVVSFDAKADIAQNIRCYFCSPNTTTSSLSSTGQTATGADGVALVDLTTEWARYWVKWTQTPATAPKSIIVGRNFTENNIYIRAVKFESGHTPTHWTPAPEDMATSNDVATVQSSSDMIENRLSTAESLIEQLSDSLAVLVRDGNGESLMVQTENGWTFSTNQIQSMVDAASEKLADLTNDIGDTNSVVNSLQQAMADLGILNDYVKIGAYENEPCIELGESDSDFKLLITNTRIMFMEGSGLPAYLSNQSLFIKKAVIEEELQQGEFVWKARSNGNLGLIWKGATN